MAKITAIYKTPATRSGTTYGYEVNDSFVSRTDACKQPDGTYWTNHENRFQDTIVILRDTDRAYLKTVRDDTTVDNLDVLPIK